jgi:hypothetical protein
MEVFLGIVLVWFAIAAVWTLCGYVFIAFVYLFAGIATCVLWVGKGATWVRRHSK